MGPDGRPPGDLRFGLRRRSAVLDEMCDRIGRSPLSLRRTLLAYRVSPDLFLSADAFTDYVGRCRESGVDEFILYWRLDPSTFSRAPAYERALERIAADTMPRLRAIARPRGGRAGDP